MIKVLILCTLIAFTLTTTPSNYNWEGVWNVTHAEPNQSCDVPEPGTTVTITAQDGQLVMAGYADWSSDDSDWDLDWESTATSIPQYCDSSDSDLFCVSGDLSLENGNVVAKINWYNYQAYGCYATLSRPAL